MTPEELKKTEDYIQYKNFIPLYYLNPEIFKEEIILNNFEFLKEFNIKKSCYMPFNKRYQKALDYYKLGYALDHKYGKVIDHYRFYTDNENNIIFVTSPYQADEAEWGKKKEEVLKRIGFTRYKKPLYNNQAVTYYIKIPANSKFNFENMKL